MTTKGLSPTPWKIRRAIARLMQLHYDTHPKRIAATVGLSPAYCRRLWREVESEQWPQSTVALQVFGEMKRNREVYCEHEADGKSEKGTPADGLCRSWSVVPDQ